MKLLLTALSVLTIGTTTGNMFYNSNNENNKKNIDIVNNNQSLFNNYFGYLGFLGSSSTWITNQSTSNKEYYSYDLTHANYQLSNKEYAYNYFIVGTDGLLQYTQEQKSLSSEDKNELANTKSQMEDNQKVTTIKDSYDPYSNSQYNSHYFNTGFTDWQYIQFGGVNKHIDISSQTNANKVKNYKNLSETLGLYYIAEAVIAKSIDESVADNLASYFISHSSLKYKIDKRLTNQIIKLIIYNSRIYNFILNAPFYINDKNYSLNFIFDNTNNLMEIYYNKWDKSNVRYLPYYSYDYTYDSFHSSDQSSRYILLNWKLHAKTWNDFIHIYPHFWLYDNQISDFLIITHGALVKTIDWMGSETNKISAEPVQKLSDSIFQVSLNEGIYIGAAHIFLDIWHDDNNIYFQWFYLSSNFNDLNIKISVYIIRFINIMS